MNNLLIALSLILSLTAIPACKGKDKNKKKSNTTQTEQQDTGNYRFTVSFFSPGDGIDNVIKEEYDQFLLKNYPSIIYESTNWGREGEIDYCFKLTELSTKDQAKFIEKSKEILNKSKKVNVAENAPCLHKK